MCIEYQPLLSYIKGGGGVKVFFSMSLYIEIICKKCFESLVDQNCWPKISIFFTL